MTKQLTHRDELNEKIAQADKERKEKEKEIQKLNKEIIRGENPTDIELNNIPFFKRSTITYKDIILGEQINRTLSGVKWQDLIYGINDPDSIRKGINGKIKGNKAFYDKLRGKRAYVKVSFFKSPDYNDNTKKDIHLIYKYNGGLVELPIYKIGFTTKTKYLRVVSIDNQIVDFIMDTADDIRSAMKILGKIQGINKEIVVQNSKFVSKEPILWPIDEKEKNNEATQLFDTQIKKLFNDSGNIIDQDNLINEKFKEQTDKLFTDELFNIYSPQASPSSQDSWLNTKPIKVKYCLGDDSSRACGDSFFNSGTGFSEKVIELLSTKTCTDRFKDPNIDFNANPFVLFVTNPDTNTLRSIIFISNITVKVKNGKYVKATLNVSSSIIFENLSEKYQQELKKRSNSASQGKNDQQIRQKFVYLREADQEENLNKLLQRVYSEDVTNVYLKKIKGGSKLQLKKQTISNNKQSLKSKNNKKIINKSYRHRINNMKIKKTIKKI